MRQTNVCSNRVFVPGVRASPRRSEMTDKDKDRDQNKEEKKPAFWCSIRRDFLTRLSTNISLCLKIARYKEASAIKKVHYREVLPFDEFIIQQFSINRTCVRYFDRNSALFNFCIQVINGVNLISRYKKVAKSWCKNYHSGRSCNILKDGF